MTRTGRPQPGISVYRWSARTGSFSTPAWLSPPPPRRRGSVCGEGLRRRVWRRGGVPGVLRRSRLAGAARPRHRAGGAGGGAVVVPGRLVGGDELSLIHISEPTRLGMISYAVF